MSNHANESLKILYVSAEVSPFAKTGGLADVAGSLPKALAEMGNDVRIAMPRYKLINAQMKYAADLAVPLKDRKETCIVREKGINIDEDDKGRIIPVYFIDNYNYFDRDGIYCYPDDGERFAFFCKALLEMLPVLNFKPDIIHCNDWHTGPICMMLKEKYMKEDFYRNISTVFTIHNLEYQGQFSEYILDFLGMEKDIFIPEKVEFYGGFNFLKSGLVYADQITTVSKKYAEEIQTEQYGERLQGVLQKRAGDLSGIVNGISYSDFDPSKDGNIARNFDAESIDNKKYNKYALQREMGLPEGDMPVLSVVSRLSGQKGLDLIINKIDNIFEHDVQFVLLGTGDKYYEDAFRAIKEKYPGKVGIHIGFNAPLAQRIYAGSDIFLMPSRFEPCGLGQIISLRYGTIPVVRATGGLAETVVDYDKDEEKGNGFSFDEFSPNAFIVAVERAIKLYREKPHIWRKLVQRALKLDFSWNNSARKYADIYARALNSGRG